MKLYVVEYIVRGRKSIGKSYPMEIVVEAFSKADAKDVAYRAFNKLGFDTWTCQSVREATPEEVATIRPPENTL